MNKPKFVFLQIETLSQFIERVHAGNVSSAAKSLQVKRQQVQQWTAKGGVFIRDGDSDFPVVHPTACRHEIRPSDIGTLSKKTLATIAKFGRKNCITAYAKFDAWDVTIEDLTSADITEIRLEFELTTKAQVIAMIKAGSEVSTVALSKFKALNKKSAETG